VRERENVRALTATAAEKRIVGVPRLVNTLALLFRGLPLHCSLCSFIFFFWWWWWAGLSNDDHRLGGLFSTR
jgi:hypothetical protein